MVRAIGAGRAWVEIQEKRWGRDFSMDIREGSIRLNLSYGIIFFPERGVIRYIRSIKNCGRFLTECVVPYHRRCNCHIHPHENLKSYLLFSLSMLSMRTQATVFCNNMVSVHFYLCKVAIRSMAVEVYSGRRETLNVTDS
jgi:hypothetical protein